MNLKDKIILLQEHKKIYLNQAEDKIFKLTEDMNCDETGINLVDSKNANIDFSKIRDDKLHLGYVGELYAQYIMQSLGYEVFPALVDDHGIDLIAIKENKHLKIQVKTVNSGTYVYFPKKKFDMLIDKDFLILYNRVDKSGKVSTYIYPSLIWKEKTDGEDWRNNQFVYKSYEGKKSDPEYGICGSNCYYPDNEYCINTSQQWQFDEKKFNQIIDKPQ